MKKTLLLASLLAIALSACGKKEEAAPAPAESTPPAVTTRFRCGRGRRPPLACPGWLRRGVPSKRSPPGPSRTRRSGFCTGRLDDHRGRPPADSRRRGGAIACFVSLTTCLAGPRPGGRGPARQFQLGAAALSGRRGGAPARGTGAAHGVFSAG
ncbi:hypothetical protein E2I21_23915 [Alcaligenaceae bacterium SAGV5]|nr:hypothetical protein [Alcaligenaceae bacterium SAGV5]